LLTAFITNSMNVVRGIQGATDILLRNSLKKTTFNLLLLTFRQQ